MFKKDSGVNTFSKKIMIKRNTSEDIKHKVVCKKSEQRKLIIDEKNCYFDDLVHDFLKAIPHIKENKSIIESLIKDIKTYPDRFDNEDLECLSDINKFLEKSIEEAERKKVDINKKLYITYSVNSTPLTAYEILEADEKDKEVIANDMNDILIKSTTSKIIAEAAISAHNNILNKPELFKKIKFNSLIKETLRKIAKETNNVKNISDILTLLNKKHKESWLSLKDKIVTGVSGSLLVSFFVGMGYVLKTVSNIETEEDGGPIEIEMEEIRNVVENVMIDVIETAAAAK